MFSDKAAVPVALGNYEDKVQLLTDVATSRQLGGVAVVLKGLDAAREQFRVHGNRNAQQAVLLITTGNNRLVFRFSHTSCKIA